MPIHLHVLDLFYILVLGGDRFALAMFGKTVEVIHDDYFERLWGCVIWPFNEQNKEAHLVRFRIFQGQIFLAIFRRVILSRSAFMSHLHMNISSGTCLTNRRHCFQLAFLTVCWKRINILATDVILQYRVIFTNGWFSFREHSCSRVLYITWKLCGDSQELDKLQRAVSMTRPCFALYEQAQREIRSLESGWVLMGLYFLYHSLYT